jgi:hypothetical protein
MGDAFDYKFYRLNFFPVEWVKKKKKAKILLENKFAVMFSGMRGC